MIHQNASFTSYTTPRISDGSGGLAAGTTTNLTGVRCLVDQPSQAQLVASVGKVADLAAVLYVLMSSLPLTPVEDAELTYQLDGAASAVTRKIAKLYPRVKEGGLSHWELWLRQR